MCAVSLRNFFGDPCYTFAKGCKNSDEGVLLGPFLYTVVRIIRQYSGPGIYHKTSLLVYWSDGHSHVNVNLCKARSV